jgi:hypothetical protein
METLCFGKLEQFAILELSPTHVGDRPAFVVAKTPPEPLYDGLVQQNFHAADCAFRAKAITLSISFIESEG